MDFTWAISFYFFFRKLWVDEFFFLLYFWNFFGNEEHFLLFFLLYFLGILTAVFFVETCFWEFVKKKKECVESERSFLFCNLFGSSFIFLVVYFCFSSVIFRLCSTFMVRGTTIEKRQPLDSNFCVYVCVCVPVLCRRAWLFFFNVCTQITVEIARWVYFQWWKPDTLTHTIYQLYT